MKHLLLFLLALAALTLHAAAEAVDPALQAAVDAAVPAQYAGYTSLTILALMMLGRWIKALQNGTGIRGWVAAIWMGTNTPKILIACLALLSLPSCQHLGPLSGLAIGYGERKQILTSDDASALREVRDVILTTPEPKQPVRVQP